MQAGHSPIVAYIICFLQHLHTRMDAEECDRDTIPVAPIRIFAALQGAGGSSSTGWKILPHCRLWGLKNIHCGKSGNRKKLTIKIRCGGLDIALGEFLAATALDARDC